MGLVKIERVTVADSGGLHKIDASFVSRAEQPADAASLPVDDSSLAGITAAVACRASTSALFAARKHQQSPAAPGERFGYERGKML